eukprot:1118500-Rhodomonas_salina.3
MARPPRAKRRVSAPPPPARCAPHPPRHFRDHTQHRFDQLCPVPTLNSPLSTKNSRVPPGKNRVLALKSAFAAINGSAARIKGGSDLRRQPSSLSSRRFRAS